MGIEFSPDTCTSVSSFVSIGPFVGNNHVLEVRADANFDASNGTGVAKKRGPKGALQLLDTWTIPLYVVEVFFRTQVNFAGPCVFATPPIIPRPALGRWLADGSKAKSFRRRGPMRFIPNIDIVCFDFTDFVFVVFASALIARFPLSPVFILLWWNNPGISLVPFESENPSGDYEVEFGIHLYPFRRPFSIHFQSQALSSEVPVAPILFDFRAADLVCSGNIPVLALVQIPFEPLLLPRRLDLFLFHSLLLLRISGLPPLLCRLQCRVHTPPTACFFAPTTTHRRSSTSDSSGSGVTSTMRAASPRFLAAPCTPRAQHCPEEMSPWITTASGFGPPEPKVSTR
ncbi:uncharacterized protein PG998_008144 [Apiospora kogelbergensis]|uniref:uncharacterized protein n=1 Tax=Apiospora kogelbergensis TaxID=1337665 RepID=UPI00312F973E